MNARLIAVKILSDVCLRGQSLTAAGQSHLPSLSDARDRALAQELAYGVCRWYFRLQALAEQLLQRPLRNRDRDLQLLLLLGLYQLLYTRVPEHAALAETVQGAAGLDKAWAKGLINGVLRNFLRQRQSLLAALDTQPQQRWSLPRWLLAAWRRDWPQQWEIIAAVSNEHPPLILRVNHARQTREHYLQLLAEQGLPATPLADAEDAILLQQAVAVSQLPGFDAGWVSVQDVAAQHVLPLLQLQPGMRVLDACAAPGGKSCHILERYPDCSLLSLDVDAARVGQISENFQRLGLRGELRTGDAADPPAWWDGQAFDRILLDAPCSGSGVIRRHPDIKILRKQEDITKLSANQLQLLRKLWPLLKNHGKLVYVTCSILKAENDEVVTQFLGLQADAALEALPVSWGREQGVGRQLLPGDGGGDGFYYACLVKRAPDSDRQ